MMKQDDVELSAIVRRNADRHPAPAALRDAIVDALRAPSSHAHLPTIRRAPTWGSWLQMGSAFAFGVVVSAAVSFWWVSTDARERLAQEAVSAHVRSLMAQHLADVGSSDRHTVKPWFSGRLDFSPPVADLKDAGFALVGGRLDYLAGHPVAALVYQHRQHIINVFVWPRASATSSVPPTHADVQGYNLTGWNNETMTFWVVSDLNRAELQQFAEQLNANTR